MRRRGGARTGSGNRPRWAMLDAQPADTTSSMQRDIMAGRPSELEAQTGAVVRLGKKTGIPTPVNDSIYAKLLPLEKRARGLA